MPLLWVIISSSTVILFFYFLSVLPKSWSHFSDKIFRKKLFVTALKIRIVCVCLLYILFELLYDHPFEFGAADSLFYNGVALEISEKMVVADFSFYSENLVSDTTFSDRGYPIVLGFFYSLVFDSILLSRIIHALLGAWSCVLIYDFSCRNFNQPTARLAGIMMMLLPNLIYYTGLNLKETVMVFLMVAAINNADKLLKEKQMSTQFVIFTFINILSLFLFRTVLGASVLFAFIFSSLLLSNKVTGYYRKSLIMFVFLLMSGFVLSSSIKDELEILIEKQSTNQEKQLAHFSNREGGNKLAKYGSKAIFAPLILSAPFSTLVDTGQESKLLLAGAMFTRSVYSFFIFIALYTIYKQKNWRRYSLILAFIFSYLTVLLFSGFVISERFHLPLLPFLAMLAAHGIYISNNENTKLSKMFIPFLLLISVIIIGWNIFKLAGRGID
jgi:hypothetical protein